MITRRLLLVLVAFCEVSIIEAQSPAPAVVTVPVGDDQGTAPPTTDVERDDADFLNTPTPISVLPPPPTGTPSASNTEQPTVAATERVTNAPSSIPTPTPLRTVAPSITTPKETKVLTTNSPTWPPPPTDNPFALITELPSVVSSEKVTKAPSSILTPTSSPTLVPSIYPHNENKIFTTNGPTGPPTGTRSASPTAFVETNGSPIFSEVLVTSASPTQSMSPSVSPSSSPSSNPSSSPTYFPTGTPSAMPTSTPSASPSTIPTGTPSGSPSSTPSGAPSDAPSGTPTGTPSGIPTGTPSSTPTGTPSSIPTIAPSGNPSGTPTSTPSVTPTVAPSGAPSVAPSSTPSADPTSAPSSIPSSYPSDSPTPAPSASPSVNPSSIPSQVPSSFPTEFPSSAPSETPSSHPSLSPSDIPSRVPSLEPSISPSVEPSDSPSSSPSEHPTLSQQPSQLPSSSPSLAPSNFPTVGMQEFSSLHITSVETTSPDATMDPATLEVFEDTVKQFISDNLPNDDTFVITIFSVEVFYQDFLTERLLHVGIKIAGGVLPGNPPETFSFSDAVRHGFDTNFAALQVQLNAASAYFYDGIDSDAPSAAPSGIPSPSPTGMPSSTPTLAPSWMPSNMPSAVPSHSPSVSPSSIPSFAPSSVPTQAPSFVPTQTPSFVPTQSPSSYPSNTPSAFPSLLPSESPSRPPSMKPSVSPSSQPSRLPSSAPSFQPSTSPSISPSFKPSASPSWEPSRFPSNAPSFQPSTSPSVTPSFQPSASPSLEPSRYPSNAPSFQPTTSPSMAPSFEPSASPSLEPSRLPSNAPSFQPSTSQQPSLLPSVFPSQMPSTIPSAAAKEFSTVQMVFIETAENTTMDNITIGIFEETALQFISENLPEQDQVTISITSVAVIEQIVQRSLTIEMNITGDVLPGDPPETFSFADAIRQGFETNLGVFQFMLVDASDFFNPESVDSTGDPNPIVNETPPQQGSTGAGGLSGVVLLATISGAAIAVVIGAFMFWRHKNRYIDDNDSWSSSMDDNSQASNMMSPSTMESASESQFSFISSVGEAPSSTGDASAGINSSAVQSLSSHVSGQALSPIAEHKAAKMEDCAVHGKTSNYVKSQATPRGTPFLQLDTSRSNVKTPKGSSYSVAESLLAETFSEEVRSPTPKASGLVSPMESEVSTPRTLASDKSTPRAHNLINRKTRRQSSTRGSRRAPSKYKSMLNSKSHENDSKSVESIGGQAVPKVKTLDSLAYSMSEESTAVKVGDDFRNTVNKANERILSAPSPSGNSENLYYPDTVKF